jgi:DNA-binding GntR family transcriptional regulator
VGKREKREEEIRLGRSLVIAFAQFDSGAKLMADRNLNDKVYQQIKRMMFNYELVPGQRLTFVELAEKLGVSRTPVNNALSILAREGFLDFEPNRGYTVHQITRKEADALYELREIIELGAIEKAIANTNPQKLQLLRRKETLFNEAIAPNGRRSRFLLDEDLHACIVGFSGNTYLTEYFREIYERIFLRHRISPLRGERAAQVPIEHRELVQAIEKRDVGRAKNAIRNHLRNGKAYVYSFIFD